MNGATLSDRTLKSETLVPTRSLSFSVVQSTSLLSCQFAQCKTAQPVESLPSPFTPTFAVCNDVVHESKRSD
jgi:hypothetical protein